MAKVRLYNRVGVVQGIYVGCYRGQPVSTTLIYVCNKFMGRAAAQNYSLVAFWTSHKKKNTSMS